MRNFCWTCHRSTLACFCSMTRPFKSSTDFAIIVHPYEAKSTIGTAWILRRSISNMQWFTSKGDDLDKNTSFLDAIYHEKRIPLLLFPGASAFNLSQDCATNWKKMVPSTHKPVFIIIDGTWTQAKAMVRKSALLSALPRVSFDTIELSEYGFKKQPRPSCLSSVEGVHRVIEVLGDRGFARPPILREHDQMIEIFRHMVRFQLRHMIRNNALHPQITRCAE